MRPRGKERFPRRKEGGRESASYNGERRGTRKRFPLREKKMKIAAGRGKRLTFAAPMCKIINN